MNLKEKITKAFSAWDTNKSIWENLKNIGGIIKDSLVEWWETSPFKVLWDTKVWPMIEPFVKSLTDLKNRIVNAFKGWDTNKSIWNNLKNIGGIIKNAVVEWWNDDKNPIKAVYNKYIAPIVEKIKGLIDKLGGVIWDLPVIGPLRPFGFIVGKSVKLSDKEEEEYNNITKLEKTIAEAGKDNAEIDEEIAKL